MNIIDKKLLNKINEYSEILDDVFIKKFEKFLNEIEHTMVKESLERIYDLLIQTNCNIKELYKMELDHYKKDIANYYCPEYQDMDDTYILKKRFEFMESVLYSTASDNINRKEKYRIKKLLDNNYNATNLANYIPLKLLLDTNEDISYIRKQLFYFNLISLSITNCHYVESGILPLLNCEDESKFYYENYKLSYRERYYIMNEFLTESKTKIDVYDELTKDYDNYNDIELYYIFIDIFKAFHLHNICYINDSLDVNFDIDSLDKDFYSSEIRRDIRNALRRFGNLDFICDIDEDIYRIYIFHKIKYNLDSKKDEDLFELFVDSFVKLLEIDYIICRKFIQELKLYKKTNYTKMFQYLSKYKNNKKVKTLLNYLLKEDLK